MIAPPSYAQIFKDGIWSQNQALVAILGLCPLLAVTTNAINGLGLGFATLVVLVASNAAISLIRNWVPREVRLPVFVLVIAALVTTVELAMQAWFYDLYKVLGIFISLIVTNCIIIGRAEAFASKHDLARASFDGLSMGLGSMLVLTVLGGTREFLAQGTLFDQAELMFGPGARFLTLKVQDFHGSLLAILPPGAFIGLGLLIATKNRLDQLFKAREAAQAITPPEQASDGAPQHA